MLTALDETLFHQSTEVMAHTTISDHRFFDRIVIGCHAPDGNLGLVTSFGVYKNNNVMDGFAMIQQGAKRQYNHRYSRSLWPDVEPTVLGPLSHKVIEPMKRLRIALEPGDYPGAYDLEWEAIAPAHLEERHFTRFDGRIVRDHMRFDQHGKMNGWISVNGEKTEVKDWFTWRDHSWGVRAGVGGFETFTGRKLDPASQAVSDMDTGHMIIVLWWATDTTCALFQVQENGNGERTYLDGQITSLTGDHPPLNIVDVRHDYKLIPGKRVYEAGTLELRTEDGQSWTVEVEAIGRAWAYKGSGYDSGYNDEKGLGVWRGQWLEEYDQYDLSDPEDVGMPDGRLLRPVHREQIARVKVNGRPGFAHGPMLIVGPSRQYGLK
ncbi:hypothetical protein DM806_22090 [Sphingobium lactosutens]|uniref:hypothetical protein n=1 Tax=Sphingobium lactosutens TaxID=522773 RepID=UPI0015BFA1D2|nr:hypothetical protein [Sphingobium lactosutens]NWK98307.1 hypothetical protein [Sphingobium lactosutens]